MAQNTALAQWNQAAPHAVATARDQILSACQLPAGETGWRDLRDEAARWSGKIVHPLLVPFFNRLMGESDAAALEGTLALIAHRPARTWSDIDVKNFPELVAPIAAALGEARGQHQRLSPPTASEFAQSAESASSQTALRPSSTSDLESELSNEDQEAAKQLVKRLSKNLCSKAGTPLSPQVIRAALAELIGKF